MIACLAYGCGLRAVRARLCAWHFDRWFETGVTRGPRRGNTPPPCMLVALVTRPLQFCEIADMVARSWGSGVIARSLNRLLTELVDRGLIARTGSGAETWYLPLGWRCGLPEDAPALDRSDVQRASARRNVGGRRRTSGAGRLRSQRWARGVA